MFTRYLHQPARLSSLTVFLLALTISWLAIGSQSSTPPLLVTAQAQKARDLNEVGDVAQLPERAKRFAVLIGVNSYEDPQIGALIGPTNDMRALEEALITNAGFDPNRILRLTSDQTPTNLRPTRGNILRALSNALKAVPADGLLLLAFSGHGTDLENRAFLLPADAQVNGDIHLLEKTAIEVADIKDMISKRSNGPRQPVTGVAQVVILLDACRNDPTSGKDISVNPLTRAYDFNLRNSNVKAFVTLYATAIGARAYESRKRQQGYFISEIVAALKGTANDITNERGEITLDRLIRYVESEVPTLVALETGNDQKPWSEIAGFRAANLVLAKATTPVAVAPVPRPVPTPVRMSTTGVVLTALPTFTTIKVDDTGKVIEKKEQQECWGYIEDLGNGVKLELVEIPAGEFDMGSNDHLDEKPIHKVKVNSFLMGKTEVTQGQWRAVSKLPKVRMDLKSAPSKFKGETLPVEQVSWDEAVEFCARLSRKTGAKYGLPSEAEWEYAARSRTTTLLAFIASIERELLNYGSKTISVASFPANAWGLFDMHGNVWEWCEDDWHKSYENAPSDGRAWVNNSPSGSSRVFRGGGWYGNFIYRRFANRNGRPPGYRQNDLGFRLVRR